MSQFKFTSEMQSLMNFDGPLTKGPIPRWQKKAMESASSSINSSNTSKTSTSTKTPSKGKSPSRSRPNTPGKTSKTPSSCDRFIPCRSAMNFDVAHYKLRQDDTQPCSPKSKDIQRVLCENMKGMDINSQRILAYQKKAPSAPEDFQNPMRVLYRQVNTPASAKASSRYIPQTADRILDAPNIIDDYYLNLIDWSANNILAAALGSQIYLWNAGTGTIEMLLAMEGNDYIASVSWIQQGDYLAVGTTSGTVELWDCSRLKRIRVLDGHVSRVGSLAWNNYVLTSGSRSGALIHHDVRQREHVMTTMSAHSQEVCGLKWSPDGRYLASGGNDNVLNIYSAVSGNYHTDTTALYSFTAHQAAVKALAWCPWQPHILASGGGTADRHIRFWNCNNGRSINAVDTHSQVCALLWSKDYRELVSGHGYANNQIVIWKYPAMSRVSELSGHTARVLHLAMSPDGSTVLSVGADETLRLWECFKKDPKQKDAKTGKAKQNLLNTQRIR